MYFKLTQILSMISRFIVANDFAGKGLLMFVPVISVIRLTFQEQPSAFVLTLPDTPKTHSHPPLSPAPGKGLQWEWETGHCITQTGSPDSLWWASFALHMGEQQLGMSCFALLMELVHIAYMREFLISLFLWVSILEGFKMNPWRK